MLMHKWQGAQIPPRIQFVRETLQKSIFSATPTKDFVNGEEPAFSAGSVEYLLGGGNWKVICNLIPYTERNDLKTFSSNLHDSWNMSSHILKDVTAKIMDLPMTKNIQISSE